MTVTDAAARPRQTAAEVASAVESATGATSYATDHHAPLRGYATLIAIFNAGFIGSLLLAAATRRPLPRLTAGDVALFGIATHKLSRLATVDFVTAPLRAPFTTYSESAGTGEVREQARSGQLRQATGELLTCPWCFGQWVAAALGIGTVFAPRLTRFVATLAAAVTVSDFLHLAYEKAKSASGQA